MKKINSTIAIILISITIWAQSPEKMSYQAVIRNASGELVTSQALGMQISILQGSESGTPVYTETQTPTTNANGLVSIEIGTGTTSDDFSIIDWGADTYFIKTETDPTGGQTYTITGTSQMLSVPYALHSKTAESITGTITESQISDLQSYLTSETDPIFGASVANGITGADTINWNNKLDNETDPEFTAWDKDYDDLINPPTTITTAQAIAIADNSGKDTTGIYHANRTALDLVSGTNTGDQDISGIAVNEQAIQDTAVQIRADIPIVKTYSIGDFAQGGIVFWVDETGQHGLVCAKEDQSTGVRWYAGTNGNTQAKGDGPFAGESNTSIIIAAQVAIGDDGSTYAARICNELQITESGKTYGDWYLPSKKELDLMYDNKATINTTATANSGSSFASAYYWSSTEYGNYLAWKQIFAYGNQYPNFHGKYYTYRVRAVRAF